MQGDTRTRLLQAAERILIEEGVRALTTRRVGEISSLNPTLITYHFGTVSSLLGELLDWNLEPMLEAWETLEAPVPEGNDPLETALARWLCPLLASAALNPGGRALVVIDEIAAHGEVEISNRLLVHMAAIADRVFACIAPLLPDLEPGELRARMRFIAGAALGPPPRTRLSLERPDPAMGPLALAALLRFAVAALTGGTALRRPEAALASSAPNS